MNGEGLSFYITTGIRFISAERQQSIVRSEPIAPAIERAPGSAFALAEDRYENPASAQIELTLNFEKSCL